MGLSRRLCVVLAGAVTTTVFAVAPSSIASSSPGSLVAHVTIGQSDQWCSPWPSCVTSTPEPVDGTVDVSWTTARTPDPGTTFVATARDGAGKTIDTCQTSTLGCSLPAVAYGTTLTVSVSASSGGPDSPPSNTLEVVPVPDYLCRPPDQIIEDNASSTSLSVESGHLLVGVGQLRCVNALHTSTYWSSSVTNISTGATCSASSSCTFTGLLPSHLYSISAVSIILWNDHVGHVLVTKQFAPTALMKTGPFGALTSAPVATAAETLWLGPTSRSTTITVTSGRHDMASCLAWSSGTCSVTLPAQSAGIHHFVVTDGFSSSPLTLYSPTLHLPSAAAHSAARFSVTVSPCAPGTAVTLSVSGRKPFVASAGVMGAAVFSVPVTPRGSATVTASVAGALVGHATVLIH